VNVDHDSLFRVFIHHQPKLLLRSEHTTREHPIQLPSILLLCLLILPPTLRLTLHLSHVELLHLHLHLLILHLVTQERLVHPHILSISVVEVILIEIVPLLISLILDVLPFESSVVIQKLLSYL
jgi:hypothetical protein